jgi:hypothetical protein
MTSILTCVAFLALQAADNDAMTREHLEPLLKGGDEAEVVQVFRRHPDHVLPFIDEYLEGGLKMIEDGKSRDEARASFRTGVRFAKLADKAAGEDSDVFQEYAASFASWSPSEQKQFREGQREFRAGRSAKEGPDEALKHYKKSLGLARPLGDTWGTAMAYGGIAEASLKLGDLQASYDAAHEALVSNHQLQLRTASIQMHMLIAQAHEHNKEGELGGGGFGGGGGGIFDGGSMVYEPPSARAYEVAFDLLQEGDPAELREKVVNAYAASLEKAGMKDRAEQLRKGNPTASTTQPKP